MRMAELFAGIGGFSLGFERAGFDVAWQCEIDAFCRAVLNEHWPEIPQYEDVTKLRGAEVERVDVPAGGFPCQDISTAGKGRGIKGRRSGLWSEFARLIGELSPNYVVVENVAAIKAKGRGLGRVLADLSALGYDAEWDCLSASAFGAPHPRDRFWLIAYPNSHRKPNGAFYARQRPGKLGGVAYPNRLDGRARRERRSAASGQRQSKSERSLQMADATSECERESSNKSNSVTASRPQRDELGNSSSPTADAHRARRKEHTRSSAVLPQFSDPSRVSTVTYTDSEPSVRPAEPRSERGHWELEPDVGRVANGVPLRVDRLEALGNALVPQISEWIASRIAEYEELKCL